MRVMPSLNLSHGWEVIDDLKNEREIKKGNNNNFKLIGGTAIGLARPLGLTIEARSNKIELTFLKGLFNKQKIIYGHSRKFRKLMRNTCKIEESMASTISPVS